MRRAHHDRVTPPNVTKCPKCDEPKLSHRPCTHCGDYRGREVLVIEESKE
jgi:large subunit ribosomal protein L32